jgi:riboflavin biosynthesis pyrimidine reductase
VLLSAAMSADGYIDDASGHGPELSDAADWDRVDELRSLTLSEMLLELRFSAIGNDGV